MDFDLTVSKAKTGGGNFAVGSAASYTFTVSNVGGRATTGAYTFTDTLPAGLAITSNAPTGWTVGTGWTCAVSGGNNAAGGNRISCTRSTAINAGASSTTVVVPVTVTAPAAPSVTNTVSVTGVNEAPANTGNNSFTVSTDVNAPDLTITKSHNGSLAVGANEQYTVTVTNVGEVATSGTITVTDTLPASLSYVSAAGTGWTCGRSGQVVTCTRGTALATNTSAPPIVITVTPTAGGTVVNTATVSGGNEPAGNNGNNQASDTTVVYFPPVIAKSFAPNSIPSGGTSTLTITITNPAGSGVAAVTGLTFTDPFPAGMSVASPANLVNTCGGTVSPGTTQGDTVLALTGGTSGAPGTSCQIQVTITATGVGTKTNTTGEVRSANSGTGNFATANLTVTAPGSPVLTKVSSPSVVGVGETAVLTFTISNKATATADMGFRDTLPAGVTTVGTTYGGTCTSTGGAALARTVTAGNPTLLNISGVDLTGGASCTITIPIRATAAGSYANTSANISNLAGGLTATNVNDVLEVQAATLTKAFAPSTILANTTTTMSLVLTNGNAAPEQNGIAFTETLPAGLRLAAVPAASQCGGTVTGALNGTTVTVSGATLANGLASCTITASVTGSAAGTYTNAAANVTGLSANLVNNVNAALTVTVPLPTLAKTNNQTSISPGDTTTYVITVGNVTGAAISGSPGVLLQDPVVTNLALTSVTCAAQGGATCPATSVAALQGAGLSIASLPNNGTLTFTVQAQLTGNPTGTLTNVVTAQASGSSVSAQDSDTIVYPGLLNTKTVAVLNDPVNGTSNPKNIPGAEALYTIVVANTGAGRVDANSVIVSDAIPANTSLFVGNLGGSPAGPVTFADSGSGLTFSFAALNSGADDLEFSSNNGASWGYTPTPDANGYDAAVTNVRMRPKGRMNGYGGAGSYPAFTLVFKVRIK